MSVTGHSGRNTAFACWDRAHLHMYTLADGTNLGRAVPGMESFSTTLLTAHQPR